MIRRSAQSAALVFSTSILFATRAPAAEVLVVDAAGGPGSTFTAIQPAVDAAAPGDVILVRSGAYATFAVHAKPLSVVADTGHTVTVAHELTVRFTPAGGAVHLVGLTIGVPFAPEQRALVLGANDGVVWVEDCELWGGYRVAVNGPRYPAVLVHDSAHAVFARCTIYGGSSSHENLPPDGEDALLVSGGSAVDVFEGVVWGGVGASQRDLWRDGGNGGDGAQVESGSFLFASGATFRGGRGGDAGCDSILQCGEGGNGGHGLRMQGSATAGTVSCTFLGGAGGFGLPYGEDGLGIEGSGVQDLNAPARSLAIATPVREGALGELRAQGEPGDLVVALVAASLDPRYQPWCKGVRLVPAVARLSLCGVVPSSGTLLLDFPLPALPPGTEVRSLYAQGVFTDANGVSFLGSASLSRVLDAAF